MANRPTQRSMQDLLEKQLVSLGEIQNTLTTSKLIEMGQLLEEKKALDDDDILVTEMKSVNVGINAILESVIEIKEKFLSMAIETTEDKAERDRTNQSMLKAMEDIAENSKTPKEERKEKIKSDLGNISFSGILDSITIALGSLTGVISAFVKNAKFWLNLITPDILKKKVVGAVESIGKTFADIGLWLKNSFLSGINKLSQIFEDAIKFLKNVFGVTDESMIVKVLSWLKTGVKDFFQPFIEAYEVIQELVSGPVGKVKGIFTGIAESIGKFTKLFSGVFNIVGKLMLPVTMLMTAWDTVKGAIEGYETGGILGGLQGAVEGLLKSIVVAPLDMVREAAAWILGKLGFEDVQKELESFTVEDVFNDVMDTFYGIIDLVKLSLGRVGNGILDLVSGFFKTFETIGIPQITLDLPEMLGGPIKFGPYYPFKSMAETASSMKMADSGEPENLDTMKAGRKLERFQAEKFQEEKVLNEKRKELGLPEYNPEVKPEAVTPTTADLVAKKTVETESVKEAVSQIAGSTVVSAPTLNNVSNNTTSQNIRLTVRNIETSVSNYARSRYAVQ